MLEFYENIIYPNVGKCTLGARSSKPCEDCSPPIVGLICIGLSWKKYVAGG